MTPIRSWKGVSGITFLTREPGLGKRDGALGAATVLRTLRIIVSLVCVAGMSIFAEEGFAQGTGVDRAQFLAGAGQSQSQSEYGPSGTGESVEDGHAASSPNDADIGQQEILKRAPEYQPLTLSLGSPIFYTSNAALTPNGEISDVIIAPVAAVSYDPRITQTLYLHVGARQQVFYYADNHAFDFGSLDADVGLNYIVPELNNLIFRVLYDFNRLTLDDRLGDEFFTNHTAIFNVELPMRIGRAQQLSFGADANISLAADHQSPRRNDYEGYLGYTAALTRAFSLNAVGRVALRDYHQNQRQDVSEILSVAATYWITNWCAVSAISSVAHNDSNQSVFDYDVGNVGGAAALSVKF